MHGVEVEAGVPAPREEVFDFLARLENHWWLADRWIEVIRLDSDGGVGQPVNGGEVRLRGPLGLSRTARTRVVGIVAPERIHGAAEVGGRTRAEVTWSLADVGDATRVTLRAELGRMGRLDALLWRLGGRIWMGRRLAAVLAGLGRHFALRGPARTGST